MTVELINHLHTPFLSTPTTPTSATITINFWRMSQLYFSTKSHLLKIVDAHIIFFRNIRQRILPPLTTSYIYTAIRWSSREKFSVQLIPRSGTPNTLRSVLPDTNYSAVLSEYTHSLIPINKCLAHSATHSTNSLNSAVVVVMLLWINCRIIGGGHWRGGGGWKYCNSWRALQVGYTIMTWEY